MREIAELWVPRIETLELVDMADLALLIAHLRQLVFFTPMFLVTGCAAQVIDLAAIGRMRGEAQRKWNNTLVPRLKHPGTDRLNLFFGQAV